MTCIGATAIEQPGQSRPPAMRYVTEVYAIPKAAPGHCNASHNGGQDHAERP